MSKELSASDWGILSLLIIFGILSLLHIAFGLNNVVGFLNGPNTASWVQAIGSIGALGVAIWISHRSERLSKRNAKISAKHFIEMAGAAVGGLHVAAGIRSEEASVQKARFLGELKEVQVIGQEIQIALLPPDLCKYVLTARTNVGRCIDLGSELDRYQWTNQDRHTSTQALSRDGYTITYALLKASWETLKELNEETKDIHV